MKNARLTLLQFVGSHLLELHPVNAVILLAAMWFFFSAESGRYRLFGWAYVAIFLLIFAQNGKTYYLAPAFPMVPAGGGVGVMRLLGRRTPAWRPVALVIVLLLGLVTVPAALPILPVERYIVYAEAIGARPPDAERNETAELPQFFTDMFGWDDVVLLDFPFQHRLEFRCSPGLQGSG